MMQRISRLLQHLAALGASLALIVGAPAQLIFAQGTPTAGRTWEVQAGLDDMATFGSAQAYGPDPVVIQAGDTVRWTFAGFHTVTFVPPGTREPTLIMPGPGPGELTLGPAFGPINMSGPGQRFDRTQVISAFPPEGDGGPGSAPPTFSLTFPEAGLFGYVCLLHPGMRGQVDVRPAGSALPETPVQAAARGQSTLAALTGKVVSGEQMVRPMSGAGVHVVLAGLGDTFGASLLKFVHGDLTVRRGEAVVWTNPDPFEIHTVTFPAAGTAPPEFVEPRPQPAGPPQLVIPANVASPVGGATFSGAYANSGIIGGGGSYVLRFDAPSGQYQYLCVVHPFMVGTITVID